MFKIINISSSNALSCAIRALYDRNDITFYSDNCTVIVMWFCWLLETRSQLRKHHAATDNFDELGVGKIKCRAPLLAASDVRYAGRRVSRKDIEEQSSNASVLFYHRTQ